MDADLKMKYKAGKAKTKNNKENKKFKNDNSGPGFVGIRGSRRNDRKKFEKILYNSFVCSFARSFEKFSNFSLRRRDRFDPKIAKFRAILAIFRPFEDFEFETAPKRSI